MLNQVIPAFDFSDVAALSVEERIARSIERARELIAKYGLAQFHDAPMIPHGATADELAVLERELGVSLPPEYRVFLARHRSLLLDDGYDIGGLDHAGVHYCEPLWVSDQHDTTTKYLVFAK